MMILVDTNVFSELVKPVPDAKVVDWIFVHRHETLLSALVVAEIDVGIRTTKGAGVRRLLGPWLARLIEEHAGRIVDFDVAAARRWAQLNAAVLIAERRAGTGAIDTLLAAQALALKVPFATRNVRHFEETDVRLINPWTA